jgi:RNA polymerase sigma-70 factor, ECF subfamily
VTSHMQPDRHEVRQTPDDPLFVARLKEGDDAAWLDLERRYGPRLFNLALGVLRDRVEAQDAIQQVWEKVVSQLRKFRGDSALGTWLHRIALNACLDRLRRKRPEANDSELTLKPDDGASPAQVAALRKLATAVHSEVGLWAGEDRAWMQLVMEQVPYEEIAEIFEVPIGTAKARVHRLRLRLTDAVGKEIDDLL